MSSNSLTERLAAGVGGLLVVLVLAFPVAAVAQPGIEPLLPDDLVPGCGCSFRADAPPPLRGRTVVAWLRSEPAAMRLDGQLVRLSVAEVEPGLRPPRQPGPGENVRFLLSGTPAYRVRIACTVTGSCPLDSLECEAVSYSAEIIVEAPSGAVRFDAVGECGC